MQAMILCWAMKVRRWLSSKTCFLPRLRHDQRSISNPIMFCGSLHQASLELHDWCSITPLDLLGNSNSQTHFPNWNHLKLNKLVNRFEVLKAQKDNFSYLWRFRNFCRTVCLVSWNWSVERLGRVSIVRLENSGFGGIYCLYRLHFYTIEKLLVPGI